MEIISAYLPYNLRCKVVDQGIEKIAELNGVYSDGSCVFHDTVESHKGFTEVKPILIPLSDLQKFRKELGENLRPGNEFNHAIFLNGKKRSVTGCEYWFVQKLLKHHFDVFGLIEKGKAIDVNTVKEWK